VQITVRHRPIGITIMAILAFLFGLLIALLGLVVAVAGASAGSALGSTFGTAFAGAFAVIGVIVLLFGLLYVVFAIGAWRLSGWAWWLGLIGSVLFILGGISSYSNANAAGTSTGGAIVSLVIAIVIFVYLLTPGVRRAFGH